MNWLKTRPSSFHLLSKMGKTHECSQACSAQGQPTSAPTQPTFTSSLDQSCALCIDSGEQTARVFPPPSRIKHHQLRAGTRPVTSSVPNVFHSTYVSAFSTDSLSTGLLSFPECFSVAEPVNLVAIRCLISKAGILQ